MFVLRKIVKQSETQKITPGSRLEGQRSGFIQATSRACNWISAVTGQAQALSQARKAHLSVLPRLPGRYCVWRISTHGDHCGERRGCHYKQNVGARCDAQASGVGPQGAKSCPLEGRLCR